VLVGADTPGVPGARLKLGRARHNPAVGSVGCPTLALAAAGWYETAARRRPHVGLGVCAVLRDAKDNVLLTRRAAHMRSFPSCWVMPGGGLDGPAEGMADAARRELAEESGLAPSSLSALALTPVGCWESVYPTSAEGCMGGPEPSGVTSHGRCSHSDAT
jgi:8-oxo-dGTP pyrophosphatase MutT (NUDIX family)